MWARLWYSEASMRYLNSIPRALALLFGAFFLVSLVVSIGTIASLPQFFETEIADTAPPEYHFSLFLPETASLFFSEVEAGARAAAAESGVAVSLHPIGSDTLDFRLARYSGIDGAIIFSAVPESEARRVLDQLEQARIPVVVIEHGPGGPITDPPLPFVGTNNFDLGRRIGELVAEINTDPMHLTIVYSEKSPGIQSEKDLVELGIISALGPRLASPMTRRATGLNPLDAKSLTDQILRTDPQTNILVFTDANDTLAAVQIVIDLNLVGRVQIVGFGAGDEIRDYLDRGIISGTVVVNPRKIGFNAVKVLAGLRRDGFSAGYVDTGVEVLRGRR